MAALLITAAMWAHDGPLVKHLPCVQFGVACLLDLSLAEIAPPTRYAIDEAMRNLPGGWRRFIGFHPTIVRFSHHDRIPR
jgi:hypothetical protein